MYQTSDLIPPSQITEIPTNIDFLPYPKGQESPNSKRPGSFQRPNRHAVLKLYPITSLPTYCFVAGSRKANAVKIPNLCARGPHGQIYRGYWKQRNMKKMAFVHIFSVRSVGGWRKYFNVLFATDISLGCLP